MILFYAHWRYYEENFELKEDYFSLNPNSTNEKMILIYI